VTRRALVLDYGGVMTSSMGRAFAQFCLEHGVDPARFKALVSDAYGGDARDGMMARLERGEIELDEFERWLASELSQGAARTLHAAGLKELIFRGMEADERMVDVVRRVRSHGVRTALLSNSWGSTGYERERFPDLFDAVVISAEVGLRKPEPEIYLFAAERLGVQPPECVFVDDLAQNVDGARAVGMEGIVHRNADFTVPKLEELFGVSLA
jgi:putative hydrolase of the HAD superfamily